MCRKMCFLLALVVLVPAMWAQTVDEIIAKNVQARGGMDKLKSVKTVKSTLTIAQGPGMEFPAVLIQKRGELARIEFTIQGLTGIQAYDGKDAWQVMPFMGKKDPEQMSADEAKEIQEMTDIDEPWVDYKSKGNQVELLGKEKIEGTDAYKVKVSLKNGDVKTVYFDADSFLRIKEESKRTVRGSEVNEESAIGDYKEVDGIVFPFAIESGAKGSEQKQKFTFTKIEINVPVDDAIFKMPPPAPAPPKEPAKADAPKSPDTPKN
jgi:outer membrane lipoprotein-sorting protein